MGRKLLSVFLTLALLLCLPVIAMGEAQEKSWDVKGEYLYGIAASHDGDMTVVNQGGEYDFGWIEVLSAEKYFPEEMRGEWTIQKLSGDDMEVELYSDGSAGGCFHMKSCTVGQSAEFLVTYSSDALQNDVCKHIRVFIAPSGLYATGYEYDKTEHETKTGKRYHVEAGHATPADAPLLWGYVAFTWPEDDLGENGYVDFDYDTGEFYVMARNPGDYKVKVTAILTDSNRVEIEHTIHVTGAPVEEEIPDELTMWLDTNEVNRLYSGEEGEWYLFDYHLNNDGWQNDDIEWSIEQIKGEDIHVYLRNYDDDEDIDKFNGAVDMEGLVPIGEYEFKVSVKNKTRDMQASDNFVINVVSETPGEQLPDNIYYKKIEQGSTVTIKSGKTLSFGKPIFYPSNSTVPEDHEYGVWLDGYDGDWQRDMLVTRDEVSGAHVLKGVKEGTYTVGAFLDMYGRSRGTGMEFTLVVEPAGAKVSSIAFDKNGDWENPYELVEGKSVKIKASVLPKNAKVKALRWESDWDEAVSVDQKGVITGNEVDAWVTIHAYSTDGSDIEQTIVVHVVPQTATKLTMPKKLKMKVGDAKTLTVKFKPKDVPENLKGLVWMSDNSTVAEVSRDTGVITANAAGTATIYAYAVDEHYETMTDVFAKCKVTVK